MRFSTRSGRVVFETPASRTARTAHLGPSTMVLWYRMRDALAERLPAGVSLELGHSLVGLDNGCGEGGEGDDAATLRFQTPTATTTTVRARVVVGADGGHSAVRAAALGLPPPHFAGKAIWRGVRPLPRDWDTSHRWRCVGPDPTDPAESPAAPRILLYAIPEASLPAGEGQGTLIWQLFGRWPEERVGELASVSHTAGSAADEAANRADAAAGAGARDPPSARLARALSALDTPPDGIAWPPHIREAVAGTDPEHIAEHAQSFREADECGAAAWGVGRVTTVGDAAHLGTPYLGQGTSQAYADALELGRALGRGGPTPAALRAYEAVRAGPASAVQAVSVAMHKRVEAGERVDEVGEHLALGFLAVEHEPLVA